MRDDDEIDWSAWPQPGIEAQRVPDPDGAGADSFENLLRAAMPAARPPEDLTDLQRRLFAEWVSGHGVSGDGAGPVVDTPLGARAFRVVYGGREASIFVLTKETLDAYVAKMPPQMAASFRKMLGDGHG